MGLVKANRTASSPPAPLVGGSPQDLMERLDDGDPAVRRFAARALAQVPGADAILCRRLPQENEESVRQAIFGTLRSLCTPLVIRQMLELLRSEDAALRNLAIELLGEWPQALEEHVDALLDDPDSDVRIFAVNILGLLPHPGVPGWLVRVLERESHVNVCAAAVDVLTEVGDDDAVAALKGLRQRFPDEPFLLFAVDTALRRIGAR